MHQPQTFHVNASEHALFSQCYSFFISIIKNVLPPLTSVPKIIIADRRLLLSLCTLLRFFGCILIKLPTIVANDVKHVPPILHYIVILSFALSILLSKNFQYFIVSMSLIETKTNVSTDLDNARFHGLCKNE